MMISHSKPLLDAELTAEVIREIYLASGWLRTPPDMTRKLTQKEFSKLLGVTTMSLHRWMGGQSTPQPANQRRLIQIWESIRRIEQADKNVRIKRISQLG